MRVHFRRCKQRHRRARRRCLFLSNIQDIIQSFFDYLDLFTEGYISVPMIPNVPTYICVSAMGHGAMLKWVVSAMTTSALACVIRPTIEQTTSRTVPLRRLCRTRPWFKPRTDN